MYCMMELQCRLGFHHTEGVTGAGMWIGQWTAVDRFNMENKQAGGARRGAGQSQFVLC